MKPPLQGFNSPNANLNRNITFTQKYGSSIPQKENKNDYTPSGKINLQKISSSRLSRRDLAIETIQSGCVTESEYDIEINF